MKKLFKEFKEFVSQGNALDLAVGMIIGAAFTAIVSALVTGILQPLINLIPVGETGLQTVLRKAVTDADGNILTEALILDWGAVISAIITFLLTALVLFAIIKVINKVKATNNNVKDKLKTVHDKIKHGEDAPAPEVAATEEEAPQAEPVEVVEAHKPTTEELLAEIVELLKEQNK